jgi:hypothetical protein
MMRRRRGPGLIGTMARTAVIAGTATKVSGSVAAKQQQQMAGQQQAAAAQQQAAFDAGAASVQAAPPRTPGAGGDLVAELQKLAALKESGILTDEEFSAAKARLLG